MIDRKTTAAGAVLVWSGWAAMEPVHDRPENRRTGA